MVESLQPNNESQTSGALASSSSWRKDKKFILAAGAFVVLACVSVFSNAMFDENWRNTLPEDATFASTFNKRQSGISGLFSLMEKLKMPVSRWMLPYRSLTGKNRLLLIIDPTVSLTTEDASQVARWVANGNTLIYLDDFEFETSRKFLKHAKLRVLDGKKVVDRQLVLDENMPEASHAKSVTITAVTRLKGGEPLVKDKTGGILTVVQLGRGRAIIGTCPDLVSNFRLKNTEEWANFQFLINVCRRVAPDAREILVDEKCHGFSGADNVYHFLGSRTTGLVLGQLLLILALAVYGASFRFGRLQLIDDRRAVSALDFIEGLTSAYRRARANALAGKILFTAGRQRWCKLTGVSSQESDEVLAAKWASVLNSAVQSPAVVPDAAADRAGSSTTHVSASADPDSVKELLEKAHSASQKNIGNKELTHLVRQMQSFEKDLKRGMQKIQTDSSGQS